MVLGSTAANRLQATAAVYAAGTSSTLVAGMYARLRLIVAAFAPCSLHHVRDIQCQVA